MVIFDNPAAVPAPFGQYSHVARVELGDRTLLQLSGQVAIDADGRVVGNDMASQAEYIMGPSPRSWPRTAPPLPMW